jgi:cellulose synthase/poly-beta-1,6-N-acetylglucosamine synthase-like glycosyltransferase
LIDQFLKGLSEWLASLTFQQLLLLLIIPLLVDFPRSFGKSIFLLVHALYRKLIPYPVVEHYRPTLSIIIPAHNEEAVIEKTIEAALENWWPFKEIIVVDDASTDRTYAKALRYAINGQINLIRRSASSGSKAVAVNTGAAVSKGEIIVVVDADTLLERTALAEVAKHFSDPGVDGVSGNVRVLAGDHGEKSLLVKLQSYEYLLSMEMGRRFNALAGTLIIIPGAFGAFRRGMAASLGYLDKDTITEDFDMTLKLRKPRGRLRFASGAVGWTFVPDKWQAWVRQRLRWHKGQLETLWKHRDIYLKQRFSIPLFLAVYDMLFMDAILLVARMLWLLILLALYWTNLWTLLYIYVLTLIPYFVAELTLLTSAALLSPRKSDLKYASLMPLVILFYRPLYGLVRLRAYLELLAGRKATW